MMRISPKCFAAVLLTPFMLSCGGDSTPSPPGPIATATPTPSPAPTPAPTSGNAQVLLGGAQVGQRISVVEACRTGEARFDTQGRLTGFSPSNGDVRLSQGPTFTASMLVLAPNHFVWEQNGWEGLNVGPGNFTQGAYLVRFRGLPERGEMQIARNLNQIEFGTYGMRIENMGTGANDTQCFFGGGVFDGSAISMPRQYSGYLDGMAHVTSGARTGDWRLNRSSVWLHHVSARNYRLELRLLGVPHSFEDPDGPASMTEMAHYNLDISNLIDNKMIDTTLNGVRYRIHIRLGGQGGNNAYLAFWITTADNSSFYGAAALDGALI